ncbi:MAG: immunoglobulin domain-containing protein, partial [Verrucomicrobiota bacterium]
MQSHQLNLNKSKSSRPLGLSLALSLFAAFPALAQPTVVGHSFTNDVLVGLVYVIVNFSGAVDPGTAMDPANYTLGGGATVANGVMDATGQNVTLEVANVFGGDPYTLHVSGVQDLSLIPMVATNLTGNLPPIRSSYPGGTMTYSSTFGFPIDNARDGVVASGNFFITAGVGGDRWQLDLGAPVPIGELDVWFRYNCCNQRSANVQFTIMDGASNVLWTAFKGPDYVPNGPWLNNTNLAVFPELMGQIVRIAHPVGNSDTLELSEVAVLGPSSGLCITAQPVSQTVLPGKPVTFSVAFSGANQPITFQWKHEGTNLPGATSPTLSIPSAGPANAGSYSVVVADSTSRQRTSATALLSLLIETVPPTVVGHVFTFNRFTD